MHLHVLLRTGAACANHNYEAATKPGQPVSGQLKCYGVVYGVCRQAAIVSDEVIGSDGGDSHV